MKILVPDDVVLDLNLPNDAIVSYTFGKTIAEAERDSDAIVMWGFGHRWLNEVLPSLPNLLITPHAAGGRPDNPEPTIAANAEAIRTGRLDDLINRVAL